jgi:hypothetical protein
VGVTAEEDHQLWIERPKPLQYFLFEFFNIHHLAPPVLALLSPCYKSKTAAGSILNLPNDGIFPAPPIVGKLL